MNYLTIIDIIRKGERNTRYLVQNHIGDFYSILAKTGTYGIGDTINEDEVLLLEAKKNWVDNYQKGQSYPRKEMMSHLIAYKTLSLRNNEKGFYNNTEYEHIFTSPEQNLLRGFGYDTALLEQISTIREKGELRSDFTHLTSSQAFAVNFISPLIAENKLFYLDPCFADSDYKNCEFEKIVDTGEETQFDFYAAGLSGKPSCSIEVKYSENEFGATFADPRHVDKYAAEYDGYMHQLASVEQKQYSFFEYYQIWRNLIYTVKENGQHICFLFPAFRKDLKAAVKKIIDKCKEEYKPFIHILIADEIAERIIELDEKLSPYYKELKKKYFFE